MYFVIERLVDHPPSAEKEKKSPLTHELTPSSSLSSLPALNSVLYSIVFLLLCVILYLFNPLWLPWDCTQPLQITILDHADVG